jgi:hypothetical protein
MDDESNVPVEIIIKRIKTRDKVRRCYHRHLDEARRQKREEQRRARHDPVRRLKRREYNLRYRGVVGKIGIKRAVDTGLFSRAMTASVLGIDLSELMKLERAGVIPSLLDTEYGKCFTISQATLLFIAIHEFQRVPFRTSATKQYDIPELKAFVAKHWDNPVPFIRSELSNYNNDNT